MCGFAAIVQPGRRFDSALLDALEQDLFHRGPDSGGQANEESWALVFRRLSILDLRTVADQPMTDRHGVCTLVFNGEIYNFKELRAELQAAGVQLRTQGDTEVILESYLLWGDAFVERLQGMFTFCLVDTKRNVMLAARDPFGIKPLYMLRNGSMTAFASEMHGLHRLKKPRVDEVALRELLIFGWAAGRLSNYQDIQRLPGGTMVTVSLIDGSVRERRFADPLDAMTADETTSEEAAHEAVESSIRSHLVSDVGYSLQLSGGVDSSLVAAVAAKTEGRSLTSYSASLKGHAFDESQYQQAVAKKYQLNHVDIGITGRDYAENLPNAIHHMEGPTPHGGCVILMALCKQISQKFKVVLTGEGADEMFGGYSRYGNWQKTMWQERLARVIPSAALSNRWPLAGIKRLKGFDAAVWSSVYHDFHSVLSVFPEMAPLPGAREAASDRFTDFRDRLTAVDFVAYLESLLVRQDKMSMASSVESRVPFVHWPLLKVSSRLDRKIRVPGNGETKPVLKRLAAEYLPEDLVYRRKIGLWLPYHEWFRDADLAGGYVDYLRSSNSALAAYADAPKLRHLVNNLVDGGRQSGNSLQRLVDIEVWLRQAEKAPEGYKLWDAG